MDGDDDRPRGAEGGRHRAARAPSARRSILSGELKRKAVTLKGIAATKGARAAIEAAGGTIEIAEAERRRSQTQEAGEPSEQRSQQLTTRIPASASGARYGDLKRRLLFLLGALVVYRIGTYIPVPGIDPSVLAELFQRQQGGILGMFNMFSGGALSRFSIFALGVMPYISASIIMQMMTVVVPQLEALQKEGESGRRKITQYTRYGTRGAGAVPGARHRDRARSRSRPGARPGPRCSASPRRSRWSPARCS